MFKATFLECFSVPGLAIYWTKNDTTKQKQITDHVGNADIKCVVGHGSYPLQVDQVSHRDLKSHRSTVKTVINTQLGI